MRIRTSALRRWSKAREHAKVIAIGECGLDYYYDNAPAPAQRERFEAHIEAARTTGLPLIVHTRDAEEDTAEILGSAVQQGGVTGVLHCFTGSLELARKALDLGFFISLSGHRHLQERPRPAGNRQAGPARPAAGRDRLAVPRSGPASGQTVRAGVRRRHRGVRGRIARRTPEALAEATTANFFRLFSRAAA